MAPEVQISNRYSEKSDVWALGVVFYELLHGVPPFNVVSDQMLKGPDIEQYYKL